MKKSILTTALMVTALMITAPMATGCSSNDAGTQNITVITREEGSGTRAAFVEIVGILDNKTDQTSVEAIVHDGTGRVMTAVKNDPQAIGYISLGSLNETVRGVAIDGVKPSHENVKNGHYKVARPFNITMKPNQNEVTKDFINYIISSQGQDIVNENGYISVFENGPFKSSRKKGTIIIGGSTSVYPLMEKLVESYKLINPEVVINIEAIGSTAGINGTIDGMFDLGLASRNLNDDEKSKTDHLQIALDGIAIIVNNQNALENLTMDQLKSIYRDDIKSFREIK